MANDVPEEVRAYFRQFGKFGTFGGKASAKNLTPKQRKKKASKAGKAAAANLTDEERMERAKKAALARWGKKPETPGT